MTKHGVGGSATLAARRRTRSVVLEDCPICKHVHTESDARALAGLSETPKALEKLVRGLSAKGFDWNYGPGKWSIRQIVCHLRDVETVFAVRYRKVLTEKNPPLVAWEQEDWARDTRYAKQDAKAALAAFRELRAANLETLRLAGAEAFGRAGLHPEYGALTARRMFRHQLYHDRRHLEQIAEARKARRSHGAWK